MVQSGQRKFEKPACGFLTAYIKLCINMANNYLGGIDIQDKADFKNIEEKYVVF